MKKYLIHCIIMVIMIFIFLDQNAFAQLKLVNSTQSASGNTAQGGTYLLIATSGQPTPSGEVSGGRFSLSAGFINNFGTALDQTSPTIDITEISSSQEGQIIQIDAVIRDNNEISSATLYYRRGGEPNFTSLTMTSGGDNYKADIQSNIVSLRGVEYYLKAVDVNGNESRYPVDRIKSIQISTSGEGLVKSNAQPAGNTQNAYRLISIPLDVNNKNASSIFADDLGIYDKTKWRLFSLPNGSKSYNEYSSILMVEPGAAYWLIVKDSGKKIDTGPAKSIKTDNSFEIQLNAGWNFIGNPFNFPMPLSNIKLENDSTFNIRSFTGSWGWLTSAMQPFEGYAIESNESIKLIFNPDLTGLAKASTSPTINDDIIWDINIIASCQEALDTDNRVVIIEGSSDTWDEYDSPEPPVIGQYISLYFPHHDWDRISKNYCVDARPKMVNGKVWDFIVNSNIKDNVELLFEGISGIPQEFEIWIIDEQLQKVQDIRWSNKYSYFNSEDKRNFKLLVGVSNFISETINEIQLIPLSFKLFQNYPNPFNPSTVIKYSIPKQNFVTLKVYDILGNEIALLVKEEQPSGNYIVEFDASNLSSGIYFYQLQTADFNDVNKMVLLR